MLCHLIAVIVGVALANLPMSPGDVPAEGEEFRALVKEYEQGRRDFLAAVRKAKTEAEADQVIAEKRPDEAKYIARFLGLAEKGPASRTAAEAATWILTHTPYAPDPKAVEIIARHHVTSDVIGPICGAIGFSTMKANGELLRQILRKSPHRSIRGQACLGLAQHLIFLCDRPPQDARTADLPRSISLQAEAEALLKQAISDYGDVEFGKMPMAEAAKIMLADIHRFGIGRSAPDVDGRDAQGRAFRLSDYRGKVVVLTFSGNWCGPCKGMYPDERELVERLKGRAFAILSVTMDETVNTLRQSIDKGEITWRCWWDGGVNGPICKAWDIRQYPTVYVLDPAGVIRYKSVQGHYLKKSVELLMNDLKEKNQ